MFIDAGARNKDDGMECGQDKQSQITLPEIEIHESDIEVCKSYTLQHF